VSDPGSLPNRLSAVRSPWQRVRARLGTLSAFSISAIVHVLVVFVLFANIVFLNTRPSQRKSTLALSTPPESVPVDLRSVQQDVRPEDVDSVIIRSPIVLPAEHKSGVPPALSIDFRDFGPPPAELGTGAVASLDVLGLHSAGARPSGTGRIDSGPLAIGKIGGRGDYKQLTRHMTDRVVAGAQGYKGVLVVWLVDASISMRDDSQAIAERVWSVFEGIRAADLPVRMAVVYFGEQPSLWVQPTGDIDRAMRALISVPTDLSGHENVMNALDFCLDEFPRAAGVKQYICVLTDERGDDVGKLEGTLDRLRRAKVTVYVIGREAFLRRGAGGHERYFNEQARQMSAGVTVRGLCTPEPERAYIWPWWDYLPSGFGPYALSRIAVYTGGSYYMLGARVVADAEKQPNTPAPNRVDLRKGYAPQMMQYYRPALASLKTYRALLRNDKTYRRLQRVLDRWEQKRHWYRGYFERGEIDTLVGRCDERLTYLETLIKELNKGIVPDDRLKQMRQRRWVAHYDLCRASAAYGAWSFHQYKLRFITAKRERHPFRLWRFGHPSKKAISDSKGIEARLRQRLYDYCEFVIRRHPGTPWAYSAQLILDRPDAYLHSWSIVKYVPRDPSKPPPKGPPPI